MGTDISESTLESSAYYDILAILTNTSNIPDPRSRTAGAYIYDSDPILHKSLGFNGLPYIIFELPTLVYTHAAIDSKTAWVKWKHKITVRTARDGSANTRIDVGRSDMFTICNAIHAVFNSNTIKGQLSPFGIRNLDITKESTDVQIIDQKMLYESTWTLTYENRITLST